MESRWGSSFRVAPTVSRRLYPPASRSGRTGNQDTVPPYAHTLIAATLCCDHRSGSRRTSSAFFGRSLPVSADRGKTCHAVIGLDVESSAARASSTGHEQTSTSAGHPCMHRPKNKMHLPPRVSERKTSRSVLKTCVTSLLRCQFLFAPELWAPSS